MTWNPSKSKRSVPALATVLCLSLGMTSSYVSAQTVDSTDAEDQPEYILDEFVVTDFRMSLLSAQEQKRDSNSIIDAITAEDLGEYTDQNLAESLQRVPGVQISRSENGEGQWISIRGMGPQFNVTSINNRGVRGGSGGDGGTGNRAAYGLDNVAPEMVSGVTVFKSNTANLDEGGIGGVVNIETPRPLAVNNRGGEFREFTLRGSADFSYGTEVEEFDPRLSALAVWTPNERFGILASVAYSDRTTLTQVARLIQTDSNDTIAGVENVLRPGANSQFQVNDGNVEKLGYGVTAQWKPNDDLNIVLDYLNNSNDTIRQQNNLRHQIPGNGQGIINAVVLETPQFPNIGGILESADIWRGLNTPYATNGRTATGVGTLTSFLRDDEVYGAIAEWNPNQGALTFRVDVSHSESEMDRDNRILTFNYDDVPDGFFWRRDFHGMPFLDFHGDSSNNGAPYRPDEATPLLGNIGFNVINLGNEEDIASFEAEWAAEWGGQGFRINNFHTGYKWRERTMDEVFNVFRFNANTRRNVVLAENGLTEADVPAFETFQRDFPSPSGGFLSELSGITTRAWFSPDNDAVYDFWQPLLDNSSLRPDLPGGFFARNPEAGGGGTNRYRFATEEVNAAFLMANFSGRLGDVTYRGNIGARWVDTAVASTGFRSNPQTTGNIVDGPEDFVYDSNNNIVTSGTEATTDEGSDDDILPSFNVGFTFNDDWVLRLAASKVVTRPQLSSISGSSSLTPTFEFGTDTVDGVRINSPNANLPPFEADQWEAILEYYPGNKGMFFAAGYFEKDIGSFNSTVTFNPDSWTTGGVTYVTTDDFLVEVSTPTNNADGAKITGAELQVHIPFNHFADGWIGNFGFQGSYTRLFDNETSTLDPITGANLPLVGAAEDNYSATLYYASGKFSWRTSYTFRGRNLVASNTFGGALFDEDFRAWDMNFNYRFTDKISLRLQLSNLLEEPKRQTFADGLFPYSYAQNGRSVILGVRYRL